MRRFFLACMALAMACAAPETHGPVVERLTAEDMAVYDALLGGELGLGRYCPPHRLDLWGYRWNRPRIQYARTTIAFDHLARVEGMATLVPESARRDFNRRNVRPASIVGYPLPDRPPAGHFDPNVTETVWLTLPGYSLPRTSAVVCGFHANERGEQTGNCASLRKKDGSWCIAGWTSAAQ